MDLPCGFFIPDYYVLTVHIGDFCIIVSHLHTEGKAQMLVLRKHGSLVSYRHGSVARKQTDTL